MKDRITICYPTAPPPAINADAIPKFEWERGFKLIEAGIEEALKDPALAAELAAWKKARAEKTRESAD